MSREAYGLLIGTAVILTSLLPLPLFVVAASLLNYAITRELNRYLIGRDVAPFSFIPFLLNLYEGGIALLSVALVALSVGYRDWKLDTFFRTFFLMCYPSLFLSYVVFVKEKGTFLLLVLIFSVWINDVFAYYTGRNLGKTPLFPRISPKKTLEGFVGGIVPGVIFMALMLPYPLYESIFVGLLTLLAGVFGDYFKSFIKRQLGIKDFSNLFGEHGGFTDRFDALVFASPVFYLLT